MQKRKKIKNKNKNQIELDAKRGHGLVENM